MRAGLFLLALASLSLACASPSFLQRSSVSEEEREWREKPLVRVVRLLKEMHAEISKEGSDDTDSYEKLACWCETNDKEKTKAIEIAEQRISELTAEIEELTARSGQLKTEIAKAKADREASEKALAEATEIREKEASLFADEETELVSLIDALTRAVSVIGKNHGESFMQMKAQIHHINLKFANLLRSDWNQIVDPPLASFLKHTNQKSHVLTGFEQAMEAVQEAGPAGFKSYNAASGQILGMLKQMKDTFSSNLETSRASEKAKAASFAELAAAKTREINALSEQINDKTTELSDTDVRNAQAKQDLEATSDALSADQTFLMNLKKTCAQTDADYAERTKTRQQELEAVQQTIQLLTEDSARDLFNKSLKFVQKKQTTLSVEAVKHRDQAVAVLANVARRSGSAKLALLAVSAHLDTFTKVKKAIDGMVVELKKQQKEEVEKRDWCNEELDKNEDSTKENTWKKEDLDSQIADLTSSIQQATDDISALEANIAEMHVQMKRAGEDRATANKEFQQVVADQRATKNILNKAVQRLQQFYNPDALTAAPVAATRAPQDSVMALLQNHQEPGAAVAPPPPSPKEYSQSGGGHGVITMIQMIIEDAARMEARAIKDEQSAQAAYEQFVQDTNSAVAAANREIVAKSGQKAKETSELESAKDSHKFTLAELEKLSKMNGDLHADCDYVLKNFSIRQQARSEEIEALANAKAILSGAAFQ